MPNSAVAPLGTDKSDTEVKLWTVCFSDLAGPERSEKQTVHSLTLSPLSRPPSGFQDFRQKLY